MSLEPTYGVTLPLPTPEVSTTHWASILGVFREHVSCCATLGPSEVPESLYFFVCDTGNRIGVLTNALSPNYNPGPSLFQLHLFLPSILFAFALSLGLLNLVCLCLMLASVTSPPSTPPWASHCPGEHGPQWSCVLQLLLRQASKFLPARFLAAGEPSERQMLLGGDSIPRDSYMRKLPKVGLA